jgi:hypothetical protein
MRKHTHRTLAVLVLLVTAVTGCAAPAASDSSATAGVSGPGALQWDTPEELADLACPNPDDLADCKAEIIAAAAAGQPAALCIGPQSDRWNIVRPAAGDREGSPCGPDNGGSIRAIIVGP